MSSFGHAFIRYEGPDLDHAFTEAPSSLSGQMTLTDTEGDHIAIQGPHVLGCGWWGKKGLPWNLCASTGGNPGAGGRKKYTYGHG